MHDRADDVGDERPQNSTAPAARGIVGRPDQQQRHGEHERAAERHQAHCAAIQDHGDPHHGQDRERRVAGGRPALALSQQADREQRGERRHERQPLGVLAHRAERHGCRGDRKHHGGEPDEAPVTALGMHGDRTGCKRRETEERLQRSRAVQIGESTAARRHIRAIGSGCRLVEQSDRTVSGR